MYLDIFLIVVMLISGLLAMVRGFMREILSIVAWVAAAAAAIYSFPKLVPYAAQYFGGWNEWLVKGVVAGGVFLATLIIVSIFTVRLSDKVLDSRIGALDRSLGFLFGLARGLLIVVVAFAFFNWLVLPKSQPEAIKNARSRYVLEETGNKLQDLFFTLMPEGLEPYITTIFKKKPKGDEQDEPPPDQRGEWPSPAQHWS